MKKWILPLICVVCVVVISCRSVLDKVTPADIPIISMEYAGIDPNTTSYQSLYKAKEIRDKIIVIHRERQRRFLWEIEGDKLAYQDARNAIGFNIQESQAWQDLMIGSEEQPFSILGVLAGLTGGTVIGGAFIKRKGDFTPVEHEAGIAKVKEEMKT